jgi:hypothetical protein
VSGTRPFFAPRDYDSAVVICDTKCYLLVFQKIRVSP